MACGSDSNGGMQFVIKTEDEQMFINVSQDGTIIPAELSSERYAIKTEEEVVSYFNPSTFEAADNKDDLPGTTNARSCGCDICMLTPPTVGLNERNEEAAAGLQELCFICGKSFPFVSCLTFHARSEHDYTDEFATKIEPHDEDMDIHAYTVEATLPEPDGHGVNQKSSTKKNLARDANQLVQTNHTKHQPLQHGIKTKKVQILSKLSAVKSTPSLHVGSSSTSEISSEKNSFFRCYLCSTVGYFKNKASLNTHLSTAHPIQKVYYCAECRINLPNQITYNLHLMRHNATGVAYSNVIPRGNVRPFKCSYCSLHFSTTVAKKSHEVQIHDSDKGHNLPEYESSPTTQGLAKYFKKRTRYICVVCKRRFFNKSDLMDHSTTHGEKMVKFVQNVKNYFRTPKIIINEDTFKCYFCTPAVELKSKSVLEQHLLAAHPKREKYNCRECTYSSQTIIQANSHRMRHDASFIPYKCSICEIKFYTLEARIRHEITAHGKEAE